MTRICGEAVVVAQERQSWSPAVDDAESARRGAVRLPEGH